MIDGIIAEGEWDDGGKLSFQFNSTVGPPPIVDGYLYVKHDALYLYLAMFIYSNYGNNIMINFDTQGNGKSDGDNVVSVRSASPEDAYWVYNPALCFSENLCTTSINDNQDVRANSRAIMTGETILAWMHELAIPLCSGEPEDFCLLTPTSVWYTFFGIIDTSPVYYPTNLDVPGPYAGQINIGTPADPCAGSGGDIDGDGICGIVDNCPAKPNTDQLDTDADGVGDACDNCPTVANFDQDDWDEDGIGNACEDMDGDGVLDQTDNCISKPNSDQLDFDQDGIGDVCDSCPTVANADDGDSDEDGIGDACDSAELTDPPGTADSVTYNICVTFDGNFITCEPGHRNTTITCCNGPCVFDEYSKFIPSNMLEPAIHADTSAFTIILNPDGTVAAGGDLINVTQNQQKCFDVNLLDYYPPEVLKSATSVDCFATTSCNQKDPEMVDGVCEASSGHCVEIKNYTVKTTVPTTSLNFSVDIDIRPLSERNSINPLWKGLAGVVPVAILSRGGFDARTEVKRNSLRFGVEGKEDSILRIGGTPVCAGFDVDRDNDKDLVCLFITRQMGDIGPETEKLNMSGGLRGETPRGFIASDEITTGIPRCR